MARRLGSPARLFGCVGTDELAEQALAGPRAAGVDLTGVGDVQGDTGVAAIIVGQGGSKTMVFAPGANDGFSEADGRRLAEEVRDAPDRSVLVVDTELLPAALVPALEAARAEGRSVVLDPTRPERVTDVLLELSDHVMPNADEATWMTGIRVESAADAERAARRLRERGARNIHVRLPFGGCLTLGTDGEALLRAPPDVEVVDTTGGGDAFAGALATAIIAGLPLVDAARFAVAAASCAVTGFGAQESYPSRSVLEAMAQRVTVALPSGVSTRVRPGGG
jgi:ribokinase